MSSEPRTLRLTVVVDNGLPAAGCRAEHGFACLVQYGGLDLLFDAGQDPDLLRDNCRVLGVDPAGLDGVVLSHGHYDHAGGLAWLLTERPDLPVWLHPEALGPHRTGRRPPRGATTRDIGVPAAVRKLLAAADLRPVTGPSGPAPGLCLFGAPTTHDCENEADHGFCRDLEGRVPDHFVDEISLLVDAPCGLVVVCGCAHLGVLSILDRAEHLRPGRPLVGLLGGTHLRLADSERTFRTAAALRERDLRLVAACHCTGAAGSRLAEALPRSWVSVGPGSRIDIAPDGGLTHARRAP